MLGQKIKNLLKEKGMKPTTLAHKLNVSLPRISNYINSKREPDFDMLMKITRVLDVDLNYFADEREMAGHKPLQSVLNLPVVQIGRQKKRKPVTMPIPKDFINGIEDPLSNAFVFEINDADSYFDEGSRVLVAKCTSLQIKNNAVIIRSVGKKNCVYIYTTYEEGQYLVLPSKKGVSIEKRINTPEDLENCYVALWGIKKL